MNAVLRENRVPLSEALRTEDKALARAFAWIGQNYSSDEYEAVRAGYENRIDPKFLAVCERVRRLLPIAISLGWDRKSDLRTLDLGSGAGHMGLIANCFGHSAEGIDCCDLYDALREFWRQPATFHRIEAGVPLPVGRFHSITSILTNYGRDWSIADWDEFLGRIGADHLEADGEFVISFPGDPNAEARVHLRRRATRTEGGGRLMFFSAQELAA
ncbi:hypothetical protein [Sphingopyxis sp. NJF-3]